MIRAARLLAQSLMTAFLLVLALFLGLLFWPQDDGWPCRMWEHSPTEWCSPRAR